MLKIGDFSRLARVSVKTLRHYAQLGLLEPAWIDRFSGYRYYSFEQLQTLNRILAFKDLGFSLEQIHKLLHEDLNIHDLRGLYCLKLAELEGKIHDEQNRFRRLEARLRMIDNGQTGIDYDVVLKPVQVMTVVGLRRPVESVKCISFQVKELLALLRICQTNFQPPDLLLAIYYDLEFRDRTIDVEVAIPDEKLPIIGSDLVRHVLPEVPEMACTIHREGIAELQNAYHALMFWIEANSFGIVGPVREHYYFSEDTAAGIEDAIAEIQIPVERKTVPQELINLKERFTMQPKFVTRPGFTAVGMLYHGKNENNEIAQMWQMFNPRIQEIKHVVDGAFGLCMPADEAGKFRYLASMGVSDSSEIPAGMEVWQIPGSEYAVFTCTLPTIHETYRYAFETWIPQSDYEYTGDPDFEYYDEDFDPQSLESSMEIFIPVRRKTHP